MRTARDRRRLQRRWEAEDASASSGSECARRGPIENGGKPTSCAAFPFSLYLGANGAPATGPRLSHSTQPVAAHSTSNSRRILLEGEETVASLLSLHQDG